MATPLLAYRSQRDERPRPPILIAIGIVSVFIGLLGILFALTELWILFEAVALQGSGATLTVTPNRQATTTVFFPFPQYSVFTINLACLSGLLNLVASVYLLTIGIMMVSDRHWARRLHRLYIPLKLLLVFFAAVVAWRWHFESADQLPAIGSSDLTKFIYLNLPGVVYLIALLAALNMNAVRDYYRNWATRKTN